mmetsp:Transcript_22765/g.41158  ORF Transcript_22765/g.41158 Transcript_22765/m.41158 type:complete len:317 (-) Transcript_22765:1504-2454(-)
MALKIASSISPFDRPTTFDELVDEIGPLGGATMGDNTLDGAGTGARAGKPCLSSRFRMVTLLPSAGTFIFRALVFLLTGVGDRLEFFGLLFAPFFVSFGLAGSAAAAMFISKSFAIVVTGAVLSIADTADPLLIKSAGDKNGDPVLAALSSFLLSIPGKPDDGIDPNPGGSPGGGPDFRSVDTGTTGGGFSSDVTFLVAITPNQLAKGFAPFEVSAAIGCNPGGGTNVSTGSVSSSEELASSSSSSSSSSETSYSSSSSSSSSMSSMSSMSSSSVTIGCTGTDSIRIPGGSASPSVNAVGATNIPGRRLNNCTALL